MSDIVYSVEVQFLQNGGFNAPAAGIDKLQAKTSSWKDSLMGGIAGFAGGFNRALDTIGGKILDLGVDAAKGMAAAAGVGLTAATKAAFDFNEQMENATIAMAALANANGMADGIGNGMRLSADVLRDMRKDAADLPGEFKDLVNIMSTISGATGNAGMGLHATESLAKDTMATAAVLSVPQNVAAREMSMMLEGNARHSMPMFAKLHMGMDTKDFNAMDPKKRLDTIRDALGKFTPAVDLYKNSWDAIKTTTIDNVRAASGAVGMPLFTSVKEKLKNFNDSFKLDARKKENFQRMGETIATSLDHAFHSSIEAVKHWYPVVKTFAENMYSHLKSAWDRLDPVIGKIFGKLESFMLDPQAFDKIVHAAKVMAELRVGGAVAEGAFGLAASPAGVAAAGAIGGEAILALVPPLALLALAAEGATSAYLDQSSMFHGAAKFLGDDIMASLVQIGSDFKGIWVDLQPVRETLGVGLLGVVDGLVGTFEFLIGGVKDLTGAFADAVKWIRNLTGSMSDDDPMKIERTQELFPIKAMNTLAAVKEKDRKIPHNVTHVHRVDIHVNSNQDPNRVAKKTFDILTDIARHPKVASLTGAPVVSR